jgi:hypothetical protein
MTNKSQSASGNIMAKSTPLLPKWKSNQIFKAIQNAGLNPKEFDLEDADPKVRLKHKWSKSYFIFGSDGAKYLGSYAAGDDPDWPYEVYSWETLMKRISRWLEEVKRDLETPDLWGELQREAELLGIASDEAARNTPFTADEQKEIVGKLQELEEYVRITYSLSSEQMRILDAKINYLIDALGRLGRTDWRGVFVGTIVSYVLTVAIPPESARSIFMTFMELFQAIGYLFRHGLPSGPIG